MMLRIMKKKLSGWKGAWAEELPAVLWGYQVIVRTPTEKTPFTLIYNHEAMLPVKVEMPTYRV